MWDPPGPEVLVTSRLGTNPVCRSLVLSGRRPSPGRRSNPPPRSPELPPRHGPWPCDGSGHSARASVTAFTEVRRNLDLWPVTLAEPSSSGRQCGCDQGLTSAPRCRVRVLCGITATAQRPTRLQAMHGLRADLHTLELQDFRATDPAIGIDNGADTDS